MTYSRQDNPAHTKTTLAVGWGHLSALQRLVISGEILTALGVWGLNFWLNSDNGMSTSSALWHGVKPFTFITCLLVGSMALIRTVAPTLWNSAIGWLLQVLRRCGEVGTFIAAFVYWPILFEGFHGSSLDTTRTIVSHGVVQAFVLLRLLIGGLTDRLSLGTQVAALLVTLSYPIGHVWWKYSHSDYEPPYGFLNPSNGWGHVGTYLAVIAVSWIVINALVTFAARNPGPRQPRR